MKKIFKSRKKIKIKKKIFLLLISFLCAYILSRFNIFKNNNFINILKKTSVNEIELSNIKLEGKYLINVGLNTFNNIIFTKEVFKESNINKKNNPRIYIYNTHQGEEYRILENYNLTPTVLTASYILKDKLKEYGIDSIVEDRNIKEEMNKLGYINYSDSYKISRMWLDSLEYESMDLYIDLHRDGIDYNLSNIIIDGKDYAKLMFVVGTNHDYSKNLEVVEKLIKNIENINKEISRGIFTRNYIYNQDYSSNCILIEVGGQDSTYESINNTLDVLSLAIKNYIGE